MVLRSSGQVWKPLSHRQVLCKQLLPKQLLPISHVSVVLGNILAPSDTATEARKKWADSFGGTVNTLS